MPLRPTTELYHFLARVRRRGGEPMAHALNVTVTGNPFQSGFPRAFLLSADSAHEPRWQWGMASLRIWLKGSYFLLETLFIKSVLPSSPPQQGDVVLDTFCLVDQALSRGKLEDRYFPGSVEALHEIGIRPLRLLRCLGLWRSPQKVFAFANVIRSHPERVICASSLLRWRDVPAFLSLLARLPGLFRQFRQEGHSPDERIFNRALREDLAAYDCLNLLAYFAGRKLAHSRPRIVYSWSEYQPWERAFNYGLRSLGDTHVAACQLFINYPDYFNTRVPAEDVGLCAPTEVVVNGPHFLPSVETVPYRAGPSLRYCHLFGQHPIASDGPLLVMGSIRVTRTRAMLRLAHATGRVFAFRPHPATPDSSFVDLLANVPQANGDLPSLLARHPVVLTEGSGVAVEAVVLGGKVLLYLEEGEIGMNPLCDVGRGVSWEVVKAPADITTGMAKMMTATTQSTQEAADWYRAHYFVEPTPQRVRDFFAERS
jgi:hypothetical protein